jgi:eukaryotic-like serine/threonine-protein kinase
MRRLDNGPLKVAILHAGQAAVNSGAMSRTVHQSRTGSGRFRAPVIGQSARPVVRQLKFPEEWSATMHPFMSAGTHSPKTPPTTIAHYRISAKLGEGAMGEVYRATDTKLGREVAIKLIPEDFANDAQRMPRFTREAQILASLNHPNIAAIYGVEDRALIMELVEGPTLAERIREVGTIPLGEALEFARQIADGLEAAHEKGVVHRDLKPANIKITPTGTIKLLDFGLAKADGPWTVAASSEELPSTISIARTGAGMILGTPAYMAPEQARGRNVDKRADIWAFGVILYEMLTGQKVFEGETLTDVLAAVTREDPDLARVPAQVRPMLQKCLEKDPKKRLRDIGDAMLLLTRTPMTTVAASSAVPSMVLAGIAAVLALALGGLSYLHFRERLPTTDVVRFQLGLPDNVRFTQLGVSTISPDGRKVAFAAYGADGNPRVWVHSLDSSTPIPLAEAGINQLTFPFFWSPDSRFIAFEQGGRLMTIAAEGGAPQVIADAKKPVGGQWVLGGSWNRDNVIIIGTSDGVMRVSADGGALTPVTARGKDEFAHTLPAFLPDGRHFLYLRGGGVGSRFVAVGDLNSAPEAQSTVPVLKTDLQALAVPTAPDGSLKLLFQRDATVMAQDFDSQTLTIRGEPTPVVDQVMNVTGAGLGYFTASNTGTLVYRSLAGDQRQLTWFNRAGQVLGTPGERAPYGIVKVSPDGTRAAVVLNVDLRAQPPNTDIWIVDLIKGGSIRLTFDPASDTQPVWSPDGKWIAWQSNRNKQLGLFRKAADGSGDEERLSTSEALTNLTDWSHNGYLIFALMGDLWALPAEPDATGKRTPVAVVKSPANEFGAYVSPDNRWIAYITNETGQQELFVQAFALGGGTTAGTWQVSTRGTMGVARWRGDGKELMFVNGDGAIVAVDVAPGPTFQAGAPRRLFQLPLELLALSPNRGTLVDVTRDGQRLLLIMPVQESAQRELGVILNWQESLRK